MTSSQQGGGGGGIKFFLEPGLHTHTHKQKARVLNIKLLTPRAAKNEFSHYPVITCTWKGTTLSIAYLHPDPRNPGVSKTPGAAAGHREQQQDTGSSSRTRGAAAGHREHRTAWEGGERGEGREGEQKYIVN